MARVITVRLDDIAATALRQLEISGLSRSEAVRAAIIAAARRADRARTLAAEVAEIERDEADRREMAAVAELMGALRTPR